jgi:pimeloyl-ACP methyl ester carboxylesterase
VTIERVELGLLAGAPSRTGVVVGHGGRGPGGHLFREELEALAARGHLALATDVEMPQGADDEAELRSFDAAVDVQARGLDLLAERGVTRFAFYGHSFGGARGAALAARDPRVRALVVAAMGIGAEHRIPWDLAAFVALPGPLRLFQHGTRDDVVPIHMGRALYDAAAEPKLWRSYEWDHGIDACPQARLDRYAFLDDALA